jgi:hypothetical protein
MPQGVTAFLMLIFFATPSLAEGSDFHKFNGILWITLAA